MMSLRMVKSKGALYDVDESVRPRAGLFVTPYHPPKDDSRIMFLVEGPGPGTEIQPKLRSGVLHRKKFKIICHQKRDWKRFDRVLCLKKKFDINITLLRHAQN